MKETELRAELAILRARVESSRWLMILTAVAALRSGAVKADDLFGLLEAKSVLLLSQGEETHSGALLGDLGQVKALYQDGKIDPARALVLMALLFLDAGRDRRAALEEWLSVGMPQEIAADVRALLERLYRSPP